MRGLVRNNNLSDLPDKAIALKNLGLNPDDYNRIRGLYAVSGFSNLRLQRIARSSSNFQVQLDSLNTNLSSIDLSLYANKTGDTITGTWTNTGTISANSFVVGGNTLTASTDSLFTQVGGTSRINANQAVTMSQGLAVYGLESDGAVSVSAQKTLTRTIPISINGVAYKLECA